MMFPRSVVIALFSAPFLAFAQNTRANPFTLSSGFSATAGQPTKLTWSPTTSSTVTLVLRYGNSNDLTTDSTIISGIKNSGSYTWTPANTITGRTDYTIEIVDDSDPNNYNYSATFGLTNTNPVATTSSSSASSSSTSASSSSSSASSTLTTSTSTSSSASTTSSASRTGSSSSSHSSTTTSGTSSSSLAAQLASTSTPGNGAPRATAMAGMLGVVALGALVL